ncbi:hypothetical protein GIB67_037719 [Kingdonia uniflora]|uniref:DNL-type domain-containing protein n=1 Tax=Kingdonia uniflora TaxID=39325 RepID=A0A7J7LN14_9MAGN|nr:hypothetical protein GIB67_037719 [Kingdonia uniflora]
MVKFTCNSCGERTKRIVNRLAYERGIVFMQCAGCLKHHKLVDNLGLVVKSDLRDTELNAAEKHKSPSQLSSERSSHSQHKPSKEPKENAIQVIKPIELYLRKCFKLMADGDRNKSLLALLKTMRVVLTLVLFLAMTLTVSTTPGKVNLLTLRKLALRNNHTCILVFGDSSVDPGNNNRLLTTFKGNFEPYGKNFFNGRPTGRFCNGRLPTDFIVEAIGFTKIILGFLDPHLKKENLLLGVSFASAASGYDDLTTNLTNVLFISKQLAYLKHYKLALKRIVAQVKAENIINNAIIMMSIGTNDFIQNYYLEPIRSKEFNVQQYTDYLIKCITRDIKDMHAIGGRLLTLVKIPP